MREKEPTQSGYDASFGQPDLYVAMRQEQLSLQNAGGTGQNTFYRYSPGPGRDIIGLNNRPPYIDGYYYVRRNDSVDLRKQLYALETNDVPSSGNTEVFNTMLENIHVPDDWYPYYVDPCPWCKRKSIKLQTLPSSNIFSIVIRWIILFLFALTIAGVITVAVFGR